MGKTKKKGIVHLLFNPLLLIIVILLASTLYFSGGISLSSFNIGCQSAGTCSPQTIDYAGFRFIQYPTETPCGYTANFESNVVIQGENLVLTSSGGNVKDNYKTRADITDVDELLIIWDAWAQHSGVGGAGGTISIVGSGGNKEVISDGFGASNEGKYYAPKLTKFKNNFDGTWSRLDSLNVGDIFIVAGSSAMTGKVYLELEVFQSACDGGSGKSRLNIYNIIRKENAFALCKADQFIQDKNGDGKISPDGSECFDLQTIVLNSEEAIRESYDEKLARITAELEAKNQGLIADISALKEQLERQEPAFDDTALSQRIAQLEAELKGTKSTLADVQAKDRNVINVIEAQEQFERPNFIKEFFNKIVAWIKGLLG